MLELEVNLASGADAVLAAYIFGVRVPVRLHDIQLRAHLRVTSSPRSPTNSRASEDSRSAPWTSPSTPTSASPSPRHRPHGAPCMYSALRLILWKFVAPLLVYPAKMTIPIMEN